MPEPVSRQPGSSQTPLRRRPYKKTRPDNASGRTSFLRTNGEELWETCRILLIHEPHTPVSGAYDDSILLKAEVESLFLFHFDGLAVRDTLDAPRI